jgi:hypothetical protein
MTSVLKSSLVENSAMQKLEMKEGLEDIENASIQLETVMRNILSYVSQTVLSRPFGIAQRVISLVRARIRFLARSSQVGSFRH